LKWFNSLKNGVIIEGLRQVNDLLKVERSGISARFQGLPKLANFFGIIIQGSGNSCWISLRDGDLVYFITLQIQKFLVFEIFI